MSAESVRVINAALTRQNDTPIASADDGSPEAILWHSNYEELVKTELTGPLWKFARKIQLLTALPDAPKDTDWAYALQLPADLLMLRAVIRGGAPIEYKVGPARVIWTNDNEEVYAEFTYRAPEDLWPADFKEGIIRRCEAITLRKQEKNPIADDRDEAARLKIIEARRNHAQEEKPIDPYLYPLINARRIGSGPNIRR